MGTRERTGGTAQARAALVGGRGGYEGSRVVARTVRLYSVLKRRAHFGFLLSLYVASAASQGNINLK